MIGVKKKEDEFFQLLIDLQLKKFIFLFLDTDHASSLISLLY